MAAAYNAGAAEAAMGHRQPAYGASATIAAHSIPSGTFVPGTKVQVGGHRVAIEKYLSEGGFAHVYVVKLPKAVDGVENAVLKRVAVPDKDALASMRTEVETMKKLKGHRHIVRYIDSHASQLKGGGYEVFLLMEYCNGGGLIDFMNTRLQNRLTEPEILNIISDVAEGVACMHYLKPPLLHRDLKVENVLISASGSRRRYKLCDFGSTAPPRPAATNAAEGRLIEEDVQRHTTLQYRSPEMVDVYRKEAIDEKSDIWALGVLLYKLCYYTTPFEAQGQMAILNASFKFPSYPAFSDRTKKLIASMLREHPQQRPNIYQVIREVCLMRGTEVPIKDIYTGRSQSEARRNQHLPTPEPNDTITPIVGAFKVPPTKESPEVLDITPMRRGRLPKSDSLHNNPRPSPSPLRGLVNDPFAALDSTEESSQTTPAVDEIAARFPPLDQFSLLHDSDNNFTFDKNFQSSTTKPRDISQRVTEALADEAFAQSTEGEKTLPIHSKGALKQNHADIAPNRSRAEPSLVQIRQAVLLEQPVPQRPAMVSTGTMTSPSPPPPPSTTTLAESLSSRPTFRMPSSSEPRSSSQSHGPDASHVVSTSLKASTLARPGLSNLRSRSHLETLQGPQSPASSRPSLESQRPSIQDLDGAVGRSKSAASRVRPSSVYVASNIDFLRDRESARNKAQEPRSTVSYDIRSQAPMSTSDSDETGEPTRIDSDVEFLRSMEEDEMAKRRDKRSSSGLAHNKRSSMPSISLPNSKSLMAGRFGDAFRRFETNKNGTTRRTPSASPDRDQRGLTPIAGSEATDGPSDDGNVVEELEVPPEVRRELERRRLSQEEKRVAHAAAEYRQKVANKGLGRGREAAGGEPSRAASIQSKVQSLLDDSGRASPTKTAEGYGHFTDSPGQKLQASQTASPTIKSQPPRKPLPGNPATNSIPTSATLSELHVAKARPLQAASESAMLVNRTGPRPTAPPKPHALRGRGDVQQPAATGPSSLAGRPEESQVRAAELVDDGWEDEFSKKYPSLSGLEMVETRIDKGRPTPVRVRDV